MSTFAAPAPNGQLHTEPMVHPAAFRPVSPVWPYGLSL